MRSPWHWWRERQEARTRARIDAFVHPIAASWREFEGTVGARWAGSPHTWDGLGFTDRQRRTMQAASVHLFDLLRATWERDPNWEGELLDRTIRFEGAFDNEGNVSTSVTDLDSGRSVSTAITKVS